MNLSTLSETELVTSLDTLTEKERSTTLSVLYHLGELDFRKSYLELGYSSTFAYCVRRLHYSESSAYRRITGARCLREYPELGTLFLKGKVNLCSIASAAKSIREAKTSVAEIVGKSKREVQALVQKINPKRERKESVRAVTKLPLPLLPPVRGPERYEIRFTVSKETYNEFEEAKNLLSNSLSKHLTIEGVVTKLVKEYLTPRVRKAKVANPNIRYVPKALKRELIKRDNAQCCFVSEDGTRCTEKRYLQVDHIVPFSLGGKTEAQNLRLLCPAHNRLMALRVFSKTVNHPVTFER